MCCKYDQWFWHSAPRFAQQKVWGPANQMLCTAWWRLLGQSREGARCAEVLVEVSQTNLGAKGSQEKMLMTRCSPHLAQLHLPGRHWWPSVHAPGALAMEMALPLPWWRCWGWCVHNYIPVFCKYMYIMALLFQWHFVIVDQHGAHIKESLPLSACIDINTPNMPGWDEDYKW